MLTTVLVIYGPLILACNALPLSVPSNHPDYEASEVVGQGGTAAEGQNAQQTQSAYANNEALQGEWMESQSQNAEMAAEMLAEYEPPSGTLVGTPTVQSGSLGTSQVNAYPNGQQQSAEPVEPITGQTAYSDGLGRPQNEVQASEYAAGEVGQNNPHSGGSNQPVGLSQANTKGQSSVNPADVEPPEPLEQGEMPPSHTQQSNAYTATQTGSEQTGSAPFTASSNTADYSSVAQSQNKPPNRSTVNNQSGQKSQKPVLTKKSTALVGDLAEIEPPEPPEPLEVGDPVQASTSTSQKGKTQINEAAVGTQGQSNPRSQAVYTPPVPAVDVIASKQATNTYKEQTHGSPNTNANYKQAERTVDTTVASQTYAEGQTNPSNASYKPSALAVDVIAKETTRNPPQGSQLTEGGYQKTVAVVDTYAKPTTKQGNQPTETNYQQATPSTYSKALESPTKPAVPATDLTATHQVPALTADATAVDISAATPTAKRLAPTAGVIKIAQPATNPDYPTVGVQAAQPATIPVAPVEYVPAEQPATKPVVPIVDMPAAQPATKQSVYESSGQPATNPDYPAVDVQAAQPATIPVAPVEYVPAEQPATKPVVPVVDIPAAQPATKQSVYESSGQPATNPDYPAVDVQAAQPATIPVAPVEYVPAEQPATKPAVPVVDIPAAQPGTKQSVYESSGQPATNPDYPAVDVQAAQPVTIPVAPVEYVPAEQPATKPVVPVVDMPAAQPATKQSVYESSGQPATNPDYPAVDVQAAQPATIPVAPVEYVPAEQPATKPVVPVVDMPAAQPATKQSVYESSGQPATNPDYPAVDVQAAQPATIPVAPVEYVPAEQPATKSAVPVVDIPAAQPATKQSVYESSGQPATNPDYPAVDVQAAQPATIPVAPVEYVPAEQSATKPVVPVVDIPAAQPATKQSVYESSGQPATNPDYPAVDVQAAQPATIPVAPVEYVPAEQPATEPVVPVVDIPAAQPATKQSVYESSGQPATNPNYPAGDVQSVETGTMAADSPVEVPTRAVNVLNAHAAAQPVIPYVDGVNIVQTANQVQRQRNPISESSGNSLTVNEYSPVVEKNNIVDSSVSEYTISPNPSASLSVSSVPRTQDNSIPQKGTDKSAGGTIASSGTSGSGTQVSHSV